MDRKIIGGVFSKVGDAERAITDLQHHGYGSDDISIFARDKKKVYVLEDEMGTSVKSNKSNLGNSASKGAGLGAISGGTLGGIAGLVVGLGLLAIPGLGQIAAAGPIAAAVTGAGVGAGGGGIVGALVGAGMTEREASQYENHLKDGKIIVLVEATEKLQDKVYRTFLTNQTENKTMYPESYNHQHQNDQPAYTNNDPYVGERSREEEYAGSRTSNQDRRMDHNRSTTTDKHHSSSSTYDKRY